MGMDTLYRIEDMACKEMDKIAEKGEFSTGTLDTAHKLVEIVKGVYKIKMLSEASEEGGYSRDGDWEARGSYGRGNSYANRGQHYVRGHYSRDGGNGQGMINTGGGGSSYASRDSSGRYSRSVYSREDGKEDMMQQLDEKMRQANDPNEREAYRRAMEALKMT